MKVMLLANQPERTTRLRHFKDSLRRLGHEVAVPSYKTKNWISIALHTRDLIKRERPDAVHIFNVPDVIYHNISKLRKEHYGKLIYDYRSPWGIELQQSFGIPGRIFGERFERELAQEADLITTVNTPLKKKVESYVPDKKAIIVPNYPDRDFASSAKEDDEPDSDGPLIFVGRVCTQEGIGKLLTVAREIPQQEFWIVGGGPFASWYLMGKPKNVKDLGWQPYEKVMELVKKAKLCLIPREDNIVSSYSNDRSIWKLNEYLNLGKLVIASGISQEEKRKNLIIVKSADLTAEIIKHIHDRPEKLLPEDYRYWQGNDPIIKEIYSRL
jgi:glycosyltransferase involved in cell wall biosynthesis